MTNRDSQKLEPEWGWPTQPATPSSSRVEDADFGYGITEPNSEIDSSVGRERVELAQELMTKGYHPVMIFGTRASGKSSLLASLFHYLQSDPHSPAIALLGEWIVPIDTNYGQSVAEAAKHFFDHVVQSFYDGEAAPSTRDEYPYYIPIKLRPNNGQEEIRLAILESRGEWYHINKSSKDLFPELREEVADVYRNYPNGISVLLIAPYLIGEAYSDDQPSELAVREMRESDTALLGALQAYQMERQHREFDNYLFILTKWDAHTRSIVDKDFVDPPRGLVAHLINERFPKSWTLFQTMQTDMAMSMQYSAGVMSGDARVDIPAHLQPIMQKFPKTLWGWLYSNATNGKELFIKNSRTGARQETGKAESFFNWLRKALT